MIEEQTDIETQEEQPPIKLSVKDFAAKVKAKYPEYKNIEDKELTDKIIAKYPEYKESVDYSLDLKKKVSSNDGAKPVESGLSGTPKVENEIKYGLGRGDISTVMATGATPSGELVYKEEAPFKAADIFGKRKKTAPYQDPRLSGTIEENIAAYEDMDRAKGAGNVAGYLANKPLEGSGSMLAGVTDIAMNLLTSVLPESMQGGTKEESMKMIREQVEPTLRTALKEKFGANVSNEREKEYNDNFVLSTVGGALHMLPAMAGYKGIGFTAQGVDNAIQTINNTEKGSQLPESTKTIFAMSEGLAQGVLLELGLGKIMGKQSEAAARKISTDAINKLIDAGETNITKELLEKTIKEGAKTLKEKLIKTGGKLLKAGAVGSGIGTGIELTNIAAEKVLNSTAGQNIFDPKSFGEELGRVMKAAKGGGALGVLLGGVHIPFAKVENHVINEVAKTKTPEDIQALKDDLIAHVQDGNISPEHAQQVSDIVDKYAKIYSTIPEHVNNKPLVAEKINERNELEAHIEEKNKELEKVDPALSKPIKEDIELAEGRQKELNKEIEEVANQPEAPTIKGEPEQPQPIELSTEVQKPSGVQNDVGITKDAQDLLASIKEGSQPTFITKNLERIAKENGVEVTDKMSAVDVINALKEKQKPQTKEPSGVSGEVENALSEDGKVSSSFMDKVNDFKKRYSDFIDRSSKYIKKDGALKKTIPESVKKEGAILAAENKILESEVSDGLSKLSKENKEKSRIETEKINADFEATQKELQKEYGLTDAEIMEATIEEKLDRKTPLTKEEVNYANENMFVPKGFEFYENGLIKSENKPINEQVKEAELPNTKKEGDTTDESTAEVKPAAETEEGSGEPPKIEADGNIAPGTGDIKGITIAANEERRQAIGMSPREKTTESFDQWDAEAIDKINKGYDINKLISKMEKGEATTPVENSIRKIYAATLDKAVQENPTNEILRQAKRYAEAEVKANAAAGRDLVSLKGNGTPRDTLTDFYVAKMEAARVDELTEAQKAEVKLDYEKVKKDRDEFETKWKQAEEAFRKSEAEKELMSHKKEPTSKTKKIIKDGKRDFKAERESLKDKLKKQVEEYKAAGQKLGVSADGGAESFVISTKIAKTITDIARSHVDEIGVKIKEVVERTLSDIKEFLGDKISEDDIMDVLAGKYNERKETQSELTAKMRELRTESQLLQEYKRLLEGGEPNTESKVIKRNQRLAELRKEIKGLEEIGKEVKSVQDAELQKRIDDNKKTVDEIDKIEKEDKVKAAKARREAQAEASKELNRLKAEFDKELREKERKKKQDEIDLVKELKRKLEYKTPAERIASQAIERNKKLEANLRERIANKDFAPKTKAKSFMESPEFKERHKDLYNQVLDSYNKKDEAQLEFERKLVEEEMKHWGKGDWIKAGIKKTSGTIKHLFASFDASAIAVQNLPLIINNPKIGGEGIVHSFKHFGSGKEFDRWLAELHTSPDWSLIKDSGLRVTEPKSLLESGREEYFPDRFKAVVKIKGKEYGWVKSKDGTKYELLDLSKPFERQFTSLSNVLRVTKFREEANKLYDDGYTFEKNPEEFTTLAKRINNLSSSSDIPQAFQSDITRTLVWSTRLLAAKLNMLGISDVASAIPGLGVKKGYYRSLGVKGQKLSRQQRAAVQDLAGFAVAVVATSYLYALATKGKVNMNPSSNGFMDVEYGDGKSMNFSGGYSRFISLLWQMKRGGKTDKLGVFKPYQGTDRVKEATSFVAGKAPPLTRAALDIAAGKDPGGKEADISTEAAKFKMPLAVGQIYDQIQKDGYGALFNEGLLTFIGFNSKDDRDYKRHVFSPETKDFIAEHQIPIGFPDNKYIKDGVPEKMTDEDYKKYVELRDKIVDDGIKQIKEKDLTKKDGEQVDYKKAVNELQSLANEQAKYHLFGNQIKNPEMPVFIKDYKPYKIQK